GRRPEAWPGAAPGCQVLKRNEAVRDYSGQPTHAVSSLSDLRRAGSENPGILAESCRSAAHRTRSPWALQPGSSEHERPKLFSVVSKPEEKIASRSWMT